MSSHNMNTRLQVLTSQVDALRNERDKAFKEIDKLKEFNKVVSEALNYAETELQFMNSMVDAKNKIKNKIS